MHKKRYKYSLYSLVPIILIFLPATSRSVVVTRQVIFVSLLLMLKLLGVQILKSWLLVNVEVLGYVALDYGYNQML